MAGEKLNKQNRAAIRRALLEHRFGERERALKQEEQELASRAYWTQIGGSDAHQKIQAIPEGWLPQTDQIRVRVEGPSGNEELFQVLNLQEPRPIPDKYERSTLIVLGDQQLGNDILSWNQERYETREKKKELATEIDAVLGSLASVKQLREHWPEAAAFLPEGDQRTAGELAVPLTRLNQDLGLAQSGGNHAAQ